MVNGETHCIPEFGGNLPFVQKPWFRSLKKKTGLEVRYLKIPLLLILVTQIEYAFCDLLGCRGLATPFGAFDEHGTFPCQFLDENGICDSRSIISHNMS